MRFSEQWLLDCMDPSRPMCEVGYHPFNVFAMMASTDRSIPYAWYYEPYTGVQKSCPGWDRVGDVKSNSWDYAYEVSDEWIMEKLQDGPVMAMIAADAPEFRFNKGAIIEKCENDHHTRPPHIP